MALDSNKQYVDGEGLKALINRIALVRQDLLNRIENITIGDYVTIETFNEFKEATNTSINKLIEAVTKFFSAAEVDEYWDEKVSSDETEPEE